MQILISTTEDLNGEITPSEGTWVFSAPATGGLDDSAHVVIDNTADDGGEGYLTANNGQVIALSDLSGIAAGSVYSVDVDMKVTSGLDYGTVQLIYYETDSEAGFKTVDDSTECGFILLR